METVKDAPQPIAGLTHARFVTEFLASLLTGRTVKSIQRKRQRGVWLEGYEWVRDPDGGVMIDMEGVQRWEQGKRGPVSSLSPQQSESHSSGRANAAGKRSPSSQPHQTS